MWFALRVLAFCAASVSASVGLVYAVRAYRLRHLGEGPPDIGTFFVGTLFTFFGLFAAFMIMTVWTQYDDATASASAEATSLLAIYQVSADMPAPSKARMRALCVEYARTMIRDEWPAMARGESSPEANKMIDEMWQIATAMGPRVMEDSAAQYSLITQLIELTKLRGERLIRARSTLPLLLYAVLVLSGS